MTKTLSVRVLAPDHTETVDHALIVGIPGEAGYAEILPGHAEAFFALKKGKVEIATGEGDDDIRAIDIAGGECRVSGSVVTFLLA